MHPYMYAADRPASRVDEDQGTADCKLAHDDMAKAAFRLTPNLPTSPFWPYARLV